MTPDFRLDARLAADTVEIGRCDAGQLRLMDDARWPWLILVPEQPDISQLHELEPDVAAAVIGTSLAICRAMAASAPGHRLNFGALGNVVSQLHVHHVLRHDTDPAWPGPVWGFGERIRYGETERLQATAHWREVLAGLL